jgi:hypothetical protein
MDLFKAVDNACRDLPEGYYAKIHMEQGCGCVELFGPDDNEIHLELSDLDLSEQVTEAVFVAKAYYNQSFQRTEPLD